MHRIFLALGRFLRRAAHPFARSTSTRSIVVDVQMMLSYPADANFADFVPGIDYGFWSHAAGVEVLDSELQSHELLPDSRVVAKIRIDLETKGRPDLKVFLATCEYLFTSTRPFEIISTELLRLHAL